MRGVVLVAVCAGCAYEPHTSAAISPDAPDASIGADADAPMVGACGVPSPSGLVACFQFDNDLATFVDDSGNGHTATATGFAPTTRPTAAGISPAALVGGNASAFIPQAADLELTGDYTITAWLQPINPDPSGNEGVIDHDIQFALSIENTNITCWFQRQTSLLRPQLPATNAAWQLVACTLTGTQACTTVIQLSGASSLACLDTAAEVAHAGQAGYSIGSFQNNGAAEEQFNGAIDDLRIYSRALTHDELCTLAERPAGC